MCMYTHIYIHMCVYIYICICIQMLSPRSFTDHIVFIDIFEEHAYKIG